ncbi:MAG: BON domain-containing protein [Planctomycetaceae bacterium]|nr:BON domain-containing protein [Planctomycetaceae bacterium]
MLNCGWLTRTLRFSLGLLVMISLVGLPELTFGQGGGTGGGGTGGGGTGGGGAGAGTGATTGGGGTGGGAPGNDFNQQSLDLGGDNYQFDDIRRPRFAGVSRETVVHPFTRVGNSEAVQTDGNSEASVGGAGGQAARTQNLQNTGNVGGMNQFNSPFGQFGGFSPFGQFGFGGLGAQQATPVRSSLSFNTTPTSHLTAPTTRSLQTPVRSQVLASRVRSIPSLQNSNVSVELVDRTAIVSGIVESEEEKQRITRVLKLEPGVSQVDNRAEVRQ